MKTLVIILLSLVALAVVFFLLSNYVVCVYQYGLGLAEDYEESKDDAEFLAEYDAFINSWNPIKRWVSVFWNMRELRNGKVVN